MIRFAHPEYLYLLFLAPLLAGIMVVAASRAGRARRRFVSESMFVRLAEEHSRRKVRLKSALVLAAVIAFPVALANPQVGTRIEEVKQEGIDLIIALDVSGSMLAEDVKPNRLEKAKFEMHSLVNRLSGDRIGLIVFSGEAYTQFPLTTDYSAADMFLDVVSTESVPTPGTAIGSSIARALASFDFEQPSTKVLVIITDGENNSGDAIGQAKEAAGRSVLIYTIGMGSPDGAPIPVVDENGREVDFKRDRSGSIVVTKLDEASLQEIASIGKGKYFRGSNTQDELDAIYRDLNSLQKHEIGAKTFTDYDDKFQYFLFIALLALVVETILSDRKTVWLSKFNPFRLLILALFFVLCAGPVAAQSVRSLVNGGNDLYDAKKYSDAEAEYRKSLEKDGNLLHGRFNLGDAEYKQQRYDEAIKEYSKALEKAPDPASQAKIYYNLGNSYCSSNRYQEGVDAYTKALKINPKDDDARYNLAYALRKIREQQQQNQKNQNDPKKNDKEKNERDKDKQQNRDQQQKQDQKQDQQQQQSDKQDQVDKKKQEQKQQQQERKMSKQEAERILQALKDEEKQTQKKLQKRIPVRINVDKDW